MNYIEFITFWNNTTKEKELILLMNKNLFKILNENIFIRQLGLTQSQLQEILEKLFKFNMIEIINNQYYSDLFNIEEYLNNHYVQPILT